VQAAFERKVVQMRKSFVFSVAAMITLGVALQASAQDRAAARASKAPAVLPAYEIVTIVRSAGLSPTGKPTRRGANYVLRALDSRGQEVRVAVDARGGEIVAITPVAYGGGAIDPLQGPSVYDSGAPVYDGGPPIYRRNPPVVIIEDDEPPLYRRAAPVPPPMPPRVIIPPERDAVIIPPPAPPEVIMTPQPPRQVIVGPPPPMSVVPPAPIINAPLPSSTGIAPQMEGDENVVLPPPPPRFEQRVNLTPTTKPAPKPKPNPSAKSNAKADVTKSASPKNDSGASKVDAKPEPDKLNASSGTQPPAPSSAPPAPLQLAD
jgi:hypothetical protein